MHVSIGAGRVMSGDQMGLVWQEKRDEVAQAHGNAPRLVADPNELANPMANVRVHGAEALTYAFAPQITGRTHAGTGHLPRQNASIEAQVVSADPATLPEERGHIVQELTQNVSQWSAVLEGDLVLDAVLLRGRHLSPV